MIRSRRQGQGLIEFSVVLVVTLFLMFTVIEVSRMLLVYTTIANSARAGVRYATTHGSTRTGSGATGPSSPANHSQVDTVVKNFASAGLINRSALLVTVTYPDAAPSNDPGDRVVVQVVYPYDAFVTYFPMRPRLGSSSQGVIAF